MFRRKVSRVRQATSDLAGKYRIYSISLMLQYVHDIVTMPRPISPQCC